MIKTSDMCIYSNIVCFLKTLEFRVTITVAIAVIIFETCGKSFCKLRLTLKFRVDTDVFIIETSIVFIAETSLDSCSAVLI